MGVVGIAIKGFGKALKKPGKAFTRAGDKWYKKTKKLQSSKKKIERIRGNTRIIAPMAVAGYAGARMGIKDALEERRRRTHAAGQVAPQRSLKELPGDIKKQFKTIKEKFKKKK
jgi:hypothetical protein